MKLKFVALGLLIALAPAPSAPPLGLPVPPLSGWTAPAGIDGPFEPYAVLDATQVVQRGAPTYYVDADLPGCGWTSFEDGSDGWGCPGVII